MQIVSCAHIARWPEARYKQLVDELAAEIRAGRLQPGTRLPTHWRLAERHGLALVTASRVYAELRQDAGLVSGEVGRGTFVREAAMHGGVGVDQRTMVPDLVDLNFNYPSCRTGRVAARRTTAARRRW